MKARIPLPNDLKSAVKTEIAADVALWNGSEELSVPVEEVTQ